MRASHIRAEPRKTGRPSPRLLTHAPFASSPALTADENILLCLFGTKRLWLYPPSDTPNIYPVATGENAAPGVIFARGGSSRSCAPPFKRLDELDPKLREQFPLLGGVRPIEVNLRGGDALYLPACWWHCVEGSEERNMILSWWCKMHGDKRSQS